MSERAISTAYEYLAAKYVRDERHTFVADPHVQTTAGGRLVVHLQQHYGGIPLFGGEVALRIADGEVVDMVGEVMHFDPNREGISDITAMEAVMSALTHFRAKSDRSVCQVRHRSLRKATIPLPTLIASFPFPSRPTVFHVGRTKSSPTANLAYWFFEGVTRLVWVIRTPFRAQSYLLIVGADGPDKECVVLCTRWSSA